jgi:hypothetical protein
MFYSRRDQIDILKSIRLNEGDTKTINCPFCGGVKKFTISNLDGRIVWNCYKASCGSKGSYSVGRSTDGIRKALTGLRDDLNPRSSRTPIPSITSSPENHPAAMQYLEEVHALPAYNAGLLRIRYAPKDQRVLFYTRNGEGAVGRSITGRTPKWWSYGDTSSGIIVGDGDTTVVVEDAASAANVGAIDGYQGLALLGTSLTAPIKHYLKCRSRVVIVLDRDASKKALSLVHELQALTNVTARITHNDLKNIEQCEIRELVGK